MDVVSAAVWQEFYKHISEMSGIPDFCLSNSGGISDALFCEVSLIIDKLSLTYILRLVHIMHFHIIPTGCMLQIVSNMVISAH